MEALAVPVMLFFVTAILITVAFVIYKEVQPDSQKLAECKSRFNELLADFQADPCDQEKQRQVGRFLRDNDKHIRGGGHILYRAALKAIEEYPSSVSLRQYALATGRFSLGRPRPAGGPSVYDEHAIHNDIQVRIRRSPQSPPRKMS
jgi:hypothetical protein